MTTLKPVWAFLIFVVLFSGCAREDTVETVAPSPTSIEIPTTSAPPVETTVSTTTTVFFIPTPEWPKPVPAPVPSPPVTLAPAPKPKPTPAPTPAPAKRAAPVSNSYLNCVKQRESRGQYGVTNKSSGAGGAYQFMPGTWNNTAKHAGRNDLVGKHPSLASSADQDAMAQHLLNWQGKAPWNGPGC